MLKDILSLIQMMSDLPLFKHFKFSHQSENKRKSHKRSQKAKRNVLQFYF